MQDSHLIKQEILNLTNSQLNWNWPISYSDSEPEYHSQRRKKNKNINKNKTRKQRKYPSQLFRLYSLIRDNFGNFNNIEQFNIKWNSPWKKSAILAEIDQNDKIIAAENHRKKIELLQ